MWKSKCNISTKPILCSPAFHDVCNTVHTLQGIWAFLGSILRVLSPSIHSFRSHFQAARKMAYVFQVANKDVSLMSVFRASPLSINLLQVALLFPPFFLYITIFHRLVKTVDKSGQPLKTKQLARLSSWAAYKLMATGHAKASSHTQACCMTQWNSQCTPNGARYVQNILLLHTWTSQSKPVDHSLITLFCRLLEWKLIYSHIHFTTDHSSRN